MADSVKFTKEEIENAKAIFNELALIFEKDNNAYLEFKSRPVTYLRKSGLLIMKRINNQNERLLSSFLSRDIRHTLFLRDIFDRCSWCKIMVLVIIYALCGSIRLSIAALRSILSDIIEAVEGILNVSNELVQKILSFLNSTNERLSPYRLARLICEHSGHC
jgi:hypothetical protein